MSTLSILAGIWLMLSILTTATLASIAARGHARRDARKRLADAH